MFSNWENSEALEKVFHHLVDVMIILLVLPMEMWNTMYKVTHDIKYQLFTAYGILKLAYILVK